MFRRAASRNTVIAFICAQYTRATLQLQCADTKTRTQTDIKAAGNGCLYLLRYTVRCCRDQRIDSLYISHCLLASRSIRYLA
ncbi:hypothetical protein DFH11DRAFT_254719 [Phellopilus nigrolimitatus]|nr:hypothetical protein DFH11DRAFT_254719 [Phellopilus nigrolimitatus]